MSLVRSEGEPLAPTSGHRKGHLEPCGDPAHTGLLPGEGEVVWAHEAVPQTRPGPGVQTERHHLVLEAAGPGVRPDAGGQVKPGLVTAVRQVERGDRAGQLVIILEGERTLSTSLRLKCQDYLGAARRGLERGPVTLDLGDLDVPAPHLVAEPRVQLEQPLALTGLWGPKMQVQMGRILILKERLDSNRQVVIQH